MPEPLLRKTSSLTRSEPARDALGDENPVAVQHHRGRCRRQDAGFRRRRQRFQRSFDPTEGGRSVDLLDVTEERASRFVIGLDHDDARARERGHDAGGEACGSRPDHEDVAVGVPLVEPRVIHLARDDPSGVPALRCEALVKCHSGRAHQGLSRRTRSDLRESGRFLETSARDAPRPEMRRARADDVDTGAQERGGECVSFESDERAAVPGKVKRTVASNSSTLGEASHVDSPGVSSRRQVAVISWVRVSRTT